MHSSRMHTARSSGRPGVVSTRHPSQEQAPQQEQAPPPEQASPPEQAPPWEQTPRAGTPGPVTPPVDRHTPVNILPCPKLRLRAVNIFYFTSSLQEKLL